MGVFERHACRVLAQPQSSQRYSSVRAENKIIFTEHIVALAS
jgi:hypothetical protein